jgi:hypothetical protein
VIGHRQRCACGSYTKTPGSILRALLAEDGAVLAARSPPPHLPFGPRSSGARAAEFAEDEAALPDWCGVPRLRSAIALQPWWPSCGHSAQL